MTSIVVQAGSSYSFTADSVGQQVNLTSNGGSSGYVTLNGTARRLINGAGRHTYNPLNPGDVVIVNCVSGQITCEFFGANAQSFSPLIITPATAITGTVVTANPVGNWRFTTGQWYASGVAISGATSPSFTVTGTQVGSVLSFQPSDLAFRGTMVGAVQAT